MATIMLRQSKVNFSHVSGQNLNTYIHKFESAVKNFEIITEEEKVKQTTALKSRFAMFN